MTVARSRQPVSRARAGGTAALEDHPARMTTGGRPGCDLSVQERAVPSAQGQEAGSMTLSEYQPAPAPGSIGRPTDESTRPWPQPSAV